MILKNIIKKQFLVLGLVFFAINLQAMMSTFEANLILKETSKEGKVLFKLKEEIIFSNNRFKKEIKYNKILKKMVEKIILFESKYKNEDLFFVESIKDENNRLWTLSTTVMSSDISVSQFTVKYKNRTVSGWINRDNKDIFGLRIFNF